MLYDTVLPALTIFILSLIIHELGHGLALYHYIGSWPKMGLSRWRFRVGTVETYWNLSDRQKFVVYLSGVMPGLVLMAFSSRNVLFLLLLLLYVLLSAKDIVLMARLVKNTVS